MFFRGKHIPLDEDGHLVNENDWSEDLADHLAELDGLELSETHWRVIGFIREYICGISPCLCQRSSLKD